MSNTVSPAPVSLWTALKTRALEPSTWAGASAMMLTAATQLPPSFQPYAFGAGALFGSLAVVMGERGSKPAEQIAKDAVAAALAIRSSSKP